MTKDNLTQISEHVYWMPPAKPDRPSLCVVVGTQRTLMLDAGASDAHARQFLAALRDNGLRTPDLIALTHWHWDHVFGAAEIGAPVIAHAETARKLAEMATYQWSDEALEQHIAAGEQTADGAENIKQELPAPRSVRIAPTTIIVRDILELSLGGVICQIEHVGGDHASDSCVIAVQPDGVLFLGDCLYDAIYTPKRLYTFGRLFPLLDRLLAFNANTFVEGHGSSVMNQAEFEALAEKMRLAGRLVERFGINEQAIFAAAQAETGSAPDEDAVYFVRALIAGIEFDHE